MSKTIPDISEMLLGASKNLAQFVASSSFAFWQRKDFRLYVDFPHLSQTEQDRMFNELEVSALGLLDLHFFYTMKDAEEAQKKVFGILQKETPESFLTILSEAGIEKKFVSVWRKLIEMRFSEYHEDMRTALSTSKEWKELRKEDSLRTAWAMVETITIDCLSHIRRGKVTKDDPLWKLLRKWILTIESTVLPLSQLGEKN